MQPIILTSREMAVLNELMQDGASNRVIGRRLYCSEDTVKTHLKRIYAKTGCHERASLVVALFRKHIVVDTQGREPDHRGVPGPASR